VFPAGWVVALAVVSLIVFALVASLTIIARVVYYLAGGWHAKIGLDALNDWLRVHKAAVMAALFLVFGVD